MLTEQGTRQRSDLEKATKAQEAAEAVRSAFAPLTTAL